ncbi:hypothetical protein [Rhodanobacter sp. MP7CTX1]|uniref:hypothetical protein n=1 Tax=Rhodanobacter sp. MP7CTX1 TaxID=2723084 RepID=UPI00161A5138|nr:hypothetical protein [Rhodanobacter sp. MP7CTX1]MBB6186007.1 hypothetical protein [Rhodanobacter sp. MP7CTX1]
MPKQAFTAGLHKNLPSLKTSVHANLALRSDPLLTPHQISLDIAQDRTLRAEAYREWFRAGVKDNDFAIFASTLNSRARRGVADSRQWQSKHQNDPSSRDSRGGRNANERVKAGPAKLNHLRHLFGTPFRHQKIPKWRRAIHPARRQCLWRLAN